MKKNLLLVFLMAVLAISMTACGGGGQQATEGDQQAEQPAAEEPAAQPEEINPETDKCVRCEMAIKEVDFGVQLVTKDGQNLKFDDLGCMYKWIQENNAADNVSAMFVKDYNTKEWINTADAVMVYNEEFKTPMGFGVYAFKDQESAQAFIDQNGGEVIDPNSHEWQSSMKKHSHE